MKDKKVIIVLLIVFVVFFIVMFLTLGIDNIKSGSYTSTLIVGDNTVWVYQDKRWNNIRNITSFQKLSWKEYNVFANNKNIGKYSMWYDDKWYVFDKNKNPITIDGNLFAFNSNYDISLLDFNINEITDRTYVDYVLNDNDLSISSSFTSSGVVSFDFDGDGVIEDFYLISNVFPEEFNPDYIFSIVFMVKNNKVYYLYKDISVNNSFNGCKPFFNTILDTNNDGLYEIILSCGRYSISEQIDMLYSFDNNEFKILISNQ